MMAISLIACENKNTKSKDTLSPSKLPEKEQALVSATSNKSFIFDFNVDLTYKEVSVWVDKYEFGKKVEDAIIHISTDIKDKGTIIFTILETTNENESMCSPMIA